MAPTMAWPKALLAVWIVILAILARAPAQPSPPSEGVQLCIPGNCDIRFPLSVSQCAPVLIYYDVTSVYHVGLSTPDSSAFLSFTIPVGTGYIEWICDIPAGYGFVASSYYPYYLTVQPGSSSSCLHDVTTTYQYAQYYTTVFQSYTSHLPNTTSPSYLSPTRPGATVSFPTGPFSTIIANPDLLPSSSSHKSKLPAIIGGSVGGFILIIALAATFVGLRRRSNSSQLETIDGPTATSEPTGHPDSRLVARPFVPEISEKSIPAIDPTTNASNPNWDPSFLYSNQTSGNVLFAPEQTGGPSSIPMTSVHRRSNFAVAQDDVSQLPPNPSQEAVTSLQSSTKATSSSVLPPMQPTSTLRHRSENEPTDLEAAFNVVSQLDPTQRRALVTVLENSAPPGNENAAGSTRPDSSARPPPPYSA